MIEFYGDDNVYEGVSNLFTGPGLMIAFGDRCPIDTETVGQTILIERGESFAWPDAFTPLMTEQAPDRFSGMSFKLDVLPEEDHKFALSKETVSFSMWVKYDSEEWPWIRHYYPYTWWQEGDDGLLTGWTVPGEPVPMPDVPEEMGVILESVGGFVYTKVGPLH